MFLAFTLKVTHYFSFLTELHTPIRKSPNFVQRVCVSRILFSLKLTSVVSLHNILFESVLCKLVLTYVFLYFISFPGQKLDYFNPKIFFSLADVLVLSGLQFCFSRKYVSFTTLPIFFWLNSTLGFKATLLSLFP